MLRKRRARLARAALLLGLVLAAGCGPSQSDGPPNVVVYMIDTLRADHLGAYGQERPTSPFFDALAREATLYEQAIAPAPWTLPSVASILTSRALCEHGLRKDGDRLGADVATWAERFQAAGYRTASFHANPYAGEMAGLDRGFDRSELRRGASVVDPDALQAWIQAGPEPFFLYLHTVEPHDPYLGEATSLAAVGGSVNRQETERINAFLSRLRQLSRADFAAGRPLGTSDHSLEQIALMGRLEIHADLIADLYAASVRIADAHLEQTVALLEHAGVFERTILAVTSDHGEEFGEHGRWLHDHSLNEELLHVPLLVRQPRGRGAGQRVPQPFSLIDLMPKLWSLAGLPPDPGRPGEQGAADAERVVAMRDNQKKYFAPAWRERGNLNVAVRAGRWKAIFNAEPETTELYDLASDPDEHHDRASQEPARAAALRARAERRLADCPPAASGDAGAARLDEAARERLRALGYLD